MNNYAIKFKGYLGDLAGRRPSPGGGSALCLAVCIGTSLMEKALRYSGGKFDRKTTVAIRKLSSLRRGMIPLIDLDGKIFGQLMASKGAKRKLLIKKSEEIMIKTGKASTTAIHLFKNMEFSIKKCIISDFLIGRDYLVVALCGVILNLEANAILFKKKSSYIEIFKNTLNQWQKF